MTDQAQIAWLKLNRDHLGTVMLKVEGHGDTWLLWNTNDQPGMTLGQQIATAISAIDRTFAVVPMRGEA